MSIDIPKRIHIAALGFEHDIIIEPLKKMLADELILVIRTDEKLGIEHKVRVEKTLNEMGMDFRIEEADLLDLVDCVRVFGRLAHELMNAGHDVYVNISSSTSISSIGASYGAMLWGAKTYYALPKEWVEEGTRKPGEPISKGLEDIFTLQMLQMNVPDKELLYILHFIQENTRTGLIDNKKVRGELERIGWLKAEDAKFPIQTLNRQFQSRYLDKLEGWGFITLQGRTRARKISVTEKGKMYLRMFEYLVDL